MKTTLLLTIVLISAVIGKFLNERYCDPDINPKMCDFVKAELDQFQYAFMTKNFTVIYEQYAPGAILTMIPKGRQGEIFNTTSDYAGAYAQIFETYPKLTNLTFNLEVVYPREDSIGSAGQFWYEDDAHTNKLEGHYYQTYNLQGYVIEHEIVADYYNGKRLHSDEEPSHSGCKKPPRLYSALVFPYSTSVLLSRTYTSLYYFSVYQEMSVLVAVQKPDISKPRWDQSNFYGRACHFLSTANPLNVFVSSAELDRSKKIVVDYKNGVYSKDMTVDELWRAKTLYDSAFHPDSGEKMFALGRMSAQVPCNMLIIGGMLAFHKKLSHVVLAHWVNQSFNSFVNYTNKSGNNASSKEELFKSYCCATGGALSVAIGANQILKAQRLSHLVRFAPFVPLGAIAVANVINITMMRYRELTDGIEVFDANGRDMGSSTAAAQRAIPKVIGSRILMALPVGLLCPMIFGVLSQKSKYRTWMAAPIQVVLAGMMLAITCPLCCALFQQRSSIKVNDLEISLRDQIKKLPNPPTVLYYNKGL